MAFNSANLVGTIDLTMFTQGSPATNRNSFAFKYSTSDNLSDVEASDYFNNAGYSPIRQFDYVGVTANDGKALYVVNSVSGAITSPSVSIFKLADIDTFRTDIW